MGPEELESVLFAVHEKFEEVKKLLDEKDKPEKGAHNEPYKTKYAAIQVLKEMAVELCEILNCTDFQNVNAFMMLAIVHLNLGMLYADTKELKTAEKEFMKGKDILKGRELDPGAILVFISALNQLGIIWSQWNEQAKAQAFLEQAEQAYKDFLNTKRICCIPINMATNFGIQEVAGQPSPKDVLESVHTLTLYYLAQVYGLLKLHDKSALYCHMTLRRQLHHNMTPKLDYIDWALNAATLSQYFMQNNAFFQARHHLAAASYMLQKYEDILKAKDIDPENELVAAEWECYKHTSADVARFWAKYGIILLGLSGDRLLKETEMDDVNSSGTEPVDKKDTKKCLENMKFDDLEENIELYANQIVDKYLLDFNDARLVFKNVQKWLEEAKQYYTLENHASDYAQIARDMSMAYKNLASFEENEDRLAKMHKRRTDILGSVIAELNPQCYMTACRQIWIELGETYSEILDIKLNRLCSTIGIPTPHALMKINHLVKSAIKNFKLFLDSLENTIIISDKLLQPALYSYFHLGRLYNKIITPDKAIQLENTQNSLNAYRCLVEYCDKESKAAQIMTRELSLCRELVNLIPLEIERLRREIANQ